MKINKKYIMIAGPVIGFSIIGMIVLAQEPGIEQLSNQYKTLLDQAQIYKQNNLKTVESACEIEQKIANIKLAEHYSGKTKQPQDKIEILTKKAKGEALDCKVF